MSAVTINHLKIKLGDNWVLKDVQLEIPQGKITSILGVNGSGKSTLVKSICKLIKKTEGTILIEGTNIDQIKPKAMAKKVAYLSQRHFYPEDLTVEELVRYGRYSHKKFYENPDASDYIVVEDALKRTGMRELSHRKLGSLSGGESQRGWIAMALAQRPDILILDEPTTFLDIYHQLEILQLMKQLQQEMGLTIIMVLHDINQAAAYSDEVVGLKDGRIFFQGTPEEILTEENIHALYQIQVKINRANGWYCQLIN